MTVQTETPATIAGRKPRAEKRGPSVPPRRLNGREVRAIEIALARGISAVDVMAIWGISYAQLRTVRDHMAAA